MPPLYSLLFAVRMLGGSQAPDGSLLHVRLTTPVGSFASRPGARVEAMLIAPLNAPEAAGGAVVFPAGSKLEGEVKSVRRVGLGLIHETASLELDFDSIAAPGGEAGPISARLIAVDNGREEVTPSGEIHEVRTTASVGNRAAHYIRDALLLATHAEPAIWAVNSLVLQVPEPEIFLPVGAELTLALTDPLGANRAEEKDSRAANVLPPGPREFTRGERMALDPVIAGLPDRTEASSGRPSDVVNVAIIGSREEVAAAFLAAGWTEARPVSIRSRLSSIVAVVEGRGSPDAPMTPLLLNDVPADMSWQKGFNDTAKRHHIRLWEQAQMTDGRALWTGAATRDVDFAFLRPGGGLLTHEVARLVDRERDKVVDDLTFTNCVDIADSWERADTPHLLTNATGDEMETDGRLAVVRLNRCQPPADPPPLAQTLPVHGKRWQLILRRQILGFRSDFIRHNWYWRSYEGLRYLVVALQHKPAPDPDAAPVETRASRLQPDWLTSIVSLR
ncbi:MAG TPA: LssY C-terminal domain-containing protein [Bryobacteraceae bacterium]